MKPELAQAIRKSLNSTDGMGPQPLLPDVRYFMKPVEVDEEELVTAVTSAAANNDVRQAFHVKLNQWDCSEDAGWEADTPRNTEERRALVLQRMGFGAPAQEDINKAFPTDLIGITVIDEKPEDWDPWYTSAREKQHEFYWPAYKRVVEKKIGPDAANKLDQATREVVRRLADPTRETPYQAKGLVMGHVQSGKTANFTGVIAKAVDAGYRLVIVLTGTIELLRGQTQRRIDMELVGRENILGGVDPDDEKLIREQGIDYASTGDQDWADGKFINHDGWPKFRGYPSIRRLTSAHDDYKALKAGLATLDFRQTDALSNPRHGVYHPDNLFGTDVRLVVVKKNSTVLAKLVKDLKSIHTKLGEIPALIIDDEADQASINTTKPDKKEQKERTAINRRIAELLGLMGRAQYVAYTATPFANVFVDPDDSEDIFPKDFIISLEPAGSYMGGKSFHDLEPILAEDRTYETSNEKAYVRDLRAASDDEDSRRSEMREALDAFVLSGAIKLYRADRGGNPGRFRHHTMLVHESMRTSQHADVADTIKDVWHRAAYSSPETMPRLKKLWEEDFLAVSNARVESGELIPESFQDLVPYIGQTVDKVRAGNSPVVVVNGIAEKEYLQDDVNFQVHDVWKILVGGQKLSRGFTVEGLTVSYYTRRTMAADSLMQMGRWFGYRTGYRDLVRLYIGREVPGPRKGVTVDLYQAFEDIVRDEEDFRQELRVFSQIQENGRPVMRPADVPPMVFQRSPWLKPTGANKMYNTEQVLKGIGGRVQDFVQQPQHDDAVNEQHFAAVRPMLDRMIQPGTFFTLRKSGGVSTYGVRYAVVSAGDVVDVLGRFQWAKNYSFKPTLKFMERSMENGSLEDWVLFLPQLEGAQQRTVKGTEHRIPMQKRTRRSSDRGGFSGSSTHQRLAMELIAGGVPPEEMEDIRPHFGGYPDLRNLHTPTRGALMWTFAADHNGASEPSSLKDPVPAKDIASLFYLTFPKLSAPNGRVAFRAKTNSSKFIVDSSDE